MVGSILSNLLLVLGMCFFAGGTRFSEQVLTQTTSHLNVSLLVLSVAAILIPGMSSILAALSGTQLSVGLGTMD